MKQKAIIVDIDGTISENVTGRPQYGKGAAEGMLEDKPRTNLIDMIRTYCDEYSVDLLVLTGRHEGIEEAVTKKWLDDNWFHPDKIFFRGKDDYSKAALYKEKVYTEEIEPYYDVLMVFEDDDSCVQMFRNKGLLVLQPKKSIMNDKISNLLQDIEKNITPYIKELSNLTNMKGTYYINFGNSEIKISIKH